MSLKYAHSFYVFDTESGHLNETKTFYMLIRFINGWN